MTAMASDQVTAVGEVRARRGEVPRAGSDARREWLIALTADELRGICREHGADQRLDAACWGWGAHGAGLVSDAPIPKCMVCNRRAYSPLWFTDGVRCWRCAAIDHLTTCTLWGTE